MQKKLIIKFTRPNTTNGIDSAFFNTLIDCSYPEEEHIRNRIESRDERYIVHLFPHLKHQPNHEEHDRFFDNLRENIRNAHGIQVAFMSSDGCNKEHCGICDYYDHLGKLCVLQGFH